MVDKKLLLYLALTALFIVFVGILSTRSDIINLSRPTNFLSGPVQPIIINGKTIEVFVADTGNERTKGLSGVTELEENQGMFFVFDKKPTEPTFWMKDVLIPLDIIWIKEDTIIKIDSNVPPPPEDTPDSQLTLYEPGQPIDFVLEVNGGFSQSNGIKPGDKIDYSQLEWETSPPPIPTN